MIIQKVSLCDNETIHKIMDHGEQIFGVPLDLEQLQYPKEVFALVTSECKAMAGYIMISCPWHPDFDDMYIGPVVVLDEYRRRGYGTMLVNFAVQRASELDRNSVSADVNKENLISQALFKKCGFNRKDDNFNDGNESYKNYYRFERVIECPVK